MRTFQIAVAAALALAGPAFAAGSTGSTTAQDREEVRAQVHRQLTTQGEVSEQDAKDLDAEVSANAAHAGYGPAIRSAIQADLAAGCKGTCLAADIHAINGAVARGVPPETAASERSHASREPADAQASAAGHRADDGHGDAAADRAHDASMGHGQAGGHGMGGGHR